MEGIILGACKVVVRGVVAQDSDSILEYCLRWIWDEAVGLTYFLVDPAGDLLLFLLLVEVLLLGFFFELLLPERPLPGVVPLPRPPALPPRPCLLLLVEGGGVLFVDAAPPVAPLLAFFEEDCLP